MPGNDPVRHTRDRPAIRRRIRAVIAFDPAQQLRDGAIAAGWNDTDLWIASVALGSNLGLGELNAITAGHREPTRGQYEVLAAALNEHLVPPGQAGPIATWQDPPPRATGTLPPPHTR